MYFKSQNCVTAKLQMKNVNWKSQYVSLQNSNSKPAEAAVRRCSSKCLQENTCVGFSFLIKFQALCLQYYSRETPTQVFSCEYCKIFKNSFFHRTSLMASAAPGVIRDLEIMLSIYKLNMTIMSFQHKMNVDIWCPRRFNI